jgi:hypothetical protein
MRPHVEHIALSSPADLVRAMQIEDGMLDPGNEFRLSVRRQSDSNVVPANVKDITPLEVFDNLSVDPAAPNYVLTVLGSDSALASAQVLSANTSVQHGVHRGGFGPTLPLGSQVGFQINLDGDGLQAVTLPAAAGTATALTDVAGRDPDRRLGADQKEGLHRSRR